LTEKCRGCATELFKVLIDLGSQPISNSLLENAAEAAREPAYPLVVYVCEECALVQISSEIQREIHFNGRYVYFSSYSQSWLDHAKVLSQECIERFNLDSKSLVVEVASNDGYLLQYFLEAGIPTLGVEPSANVAEAASTLRGVSTIVDFFGRECARRIVHSHGNSDLVIAINVLAHVPDIHDFMGGFANLLAPNGVLIFEFPHLFELLRNYQFDTIYHEHYSYLSIMALQPILEKSGIRIFDVEQIPSHGGSLRVYACQESATHVRSQSINAVVALEASIDPRDPKVREYFREGVLKVVEAFKDEIASQTRAGKRIVGYGAAAKGNTLLNYSKIDSSDIAYVIDKNPSKQGKLLPGTHIPVLDESTLKLMPPDSILILPWNLSEEIASQLRASGVEVPLFRAIPKIDFLP